MLITTIGMALPTFASTGNSIDTVVKELSELYQEEAEKGKELEDSAQCRIIVKANRKPDTYGEATLIKGTDKIYIYQYSDVTSANAALEYYNSLSYVQWAETDGIMEGQSLSYGNDMMGSDEAKSYVVNNNVSLSEVKVALIDTGVYLSGNTYKEYSHRIIDSGYNFSDSGSENTANADNPHGPKIASILLDNTSDNVKVIAYKAANKNNQGTNSALALAVDQAVKDKVSIISLSLSGTTPSSLLEESIKNAVNNNIVVVCAAGNSSDDVSKYYPANMDEVFTVGAIDKNGNRAFFSNFGEEIDFVAPGHYIETKATNNTTKEMGTSFSVPFVDAATAMVLSVYPDFTPNEVKQKLIDSCVSMNDLAYHDGFHPIEEFDYSYTGAQNNYKTYFAIGDPETKEECYGYGMPQILKAMNITEQNNSVAFSVESGTYHNGFELVLSADDDADIYYTTDESYPSANNGILYTMPILIDETTSVRAIAITKDKSKSVPIACEYKMEYCADEKDFRINNDGLITNYTGKFKEFIIPETINGITVTGISKYAMWGKNDIISITLPDTATTIEETAIKSDNLKFFKGNGITHIYELGIVSDEIGIVSLEIPNVEYIGDNAVSLSVYELNLPKLKQAGQLAFSYNSNLHCANLPSLELVSDKLFAYCITLRTVNIPKATTIGASAFENCYRLKNIYDDSLKEMQDTDETNSGAFYRCYNLTNYNNNTVEYIGEAAFSNCTSLESITLPNCICVGRGAFTDCSTLSNVNIPNVNTIDEGGFSGTYSLYELILPNAITINDDVFVNSKLKKLIAPKLNYMGAYAFSAYGFIKSLGRDDYKVNNNLEYIYAPELKDLSDYAFAYTGGLTKLDLPNLKTIGCNAFYESSVNYLDAPSLEKADSLPIAENSTAILSSKFKECSLDSNGYDLTIYGTPDTYAEKYANSNKLTFVPLPILITEPPKEYTDINDKLSVEILGFNKTYQWYGAYEPDNNSGEMIDGANDFEFNPNDFKPYPYYYCVINTVDGEYKAELRTGVSKNIAFPADYSEIDELMSRMPNDLSLYTDESVALLNNILNRIERNLPITEQDIVDGYAIELEHAIRNLKYKPADLDKLNQAINSVPDDLSVYTDESVKVLTDLIEKAKEYENADITKQAEIDGLSQQIYIAIDALELKDIPTESAKPTEPSTEPSEEPSTHPSVDTTKPSETTTETSSASQGNTISSDTKNNQNSPKRNTDTKSPLTGNEYEYIIISIAVLSGFSMLLIINSKRKKKSF